MTYLVAAVWVLSGIASWDACERHLREKGKAAHSLLARDIGRLIMMLLGPVYFVSAVCIDMERRRKP